MTARCSAAQRERLARLDHLQRPEDSEVHPRPLKSHHLRRALGARLRWSVPDLLGSGRTSSLWVFSAKIVGLYGCVMAVESSE